MAWVRWSAPGKPHPYDSLVYIMDHVDGDMECVGCQLLPAKTYRDHSRVGMAEHVQEHIDAGHAVPDFVIPSLLNYGPRWVDTTVAEMVKSCKEGGGKIATSDAEVPAEYRMSVEELIELVKKEGLGGGWPIG